MILADAKSISKILSMLLSQYTIYTRRKLGLFYQTSYMTAKTKLPNFPRLDFHATMIRDWGPAKESSACSLTRLMWKVQLSHTEKYAA